jgi:adenylate kinase
MENKGIFIFLGPPFSGKETQTIPLSKELEIPVFSMGGLIREARQTDPEINDAFEKYTLHSMHVPIDIKFDLLEQKMDSAPNGFILDNFPATAEDLDALNEYVKAHELRVNKVFYLAISEGTTKERFESNPQRGRADDTLETILKRREIQDEDIKPVLEYFKAQDILLEINGEQSIEAVSDMIHTYL